MAGREKLKNRRGETLVEVLIAILVAGISLAILASMIATSMSINTRAREMDDALYGALSDAETHAFTAGDAAITIRVTGGPTAVTLSGVRVYSPPGQDLTVYGKEGG